MSASHTAPRITICGIPELEAHSAAAVTHVLSILGPNSPDPPEFAGFPPHRRLILRFYEVIEPRARPNAPHRPPSMTTDSENRRRSRQNRFPYCRHGLRLALPRPGRETSITIVKR